MTDQLDEEDGTDSADGAPRRAGRPPNARMQRAPQRDDAARDGVRASGDLAPRRRRRRVDDKFAIDASIIPTGVSYEWKREACYGHIDHDHLINLRENGWRPVEAIRHPHMMPDGETGAIRKDGMVLMERPLALTREAQQEDYDIARQQVTGVLEAKMGETPQDTLTRDHPSVRASNRHNKSYGPLPIQD